jgi:hypothetical protein
MLTEFRAMARDGLDELERRRLLERVRRKRQRLDIIEQALIEIAVERGTR